MTGTVYEARFVPHDRLLFYLRDGWDFRPFEPWDGHWRYAAGIAMRPVSEDTEHATDE